MNQVLLFLFLLFGLTGHEELEIETTRPCVDVESALRKYLVQKHPSFRELTALSDELPRTSDRNQRIAELYKICPVSVIINSFPNKPYLTMVERANLSEDKVQVTTINLYRNEDGTCRLVVRVKEDDKSEKLPSADSKPISVDEIRKILSM